MIKRLKKVTPEEKNMALMSATVLPNRSAMEKSEFTPSLYLFSYSLLSPPFAY